MSKSQMKAKLKSIQKLPTLPVIAMEVNRLLMDHNSSISDLVDLLEKDPALVMKILRLVNSSFYGFKSRVNSLQHAITLLGYNTIRNAVVTVAVMDTLLLKKELNGFEIDSFWQHAIGVAVVSRTLALKIRVVPTEDAFIAGLLHDIGKVVLANFFPSELANILAMANEEKHIFYEAEKAMDAWPHSHIGSYLAQSWMLPDALVQTIKYHHSSSKQIVSSDMIMVVNVANRLVHMMAGHNNYHLDLDCHSPSYEKILTEAFNGGKQWYTDVRQEMDDACQFFEKE